jgi:ferric-dicitrate binding protein FerR (iron transport regulator)
VYSGDLLVTALGTTFCIRAVEGEPESKVTLTEGKVRVENFSETDPTKRMDVLNTGEEITLKIKEKRLSLKRKTTAEVSAPKAEIKSALQAGSWIYFNQTPFADVATSLEYNFGIRFTGIYPELRDLQVSYRFRGDRSLERILQDLSIQAHFEYEIRGSEVLLKKEKNRYSEPSE